MIAFDGALYGTTTQGGSKGDGTVVVMSTDGVETVLHSFSGPPDGSLPFTGVTDVNGELYGTTYAGGIDCDDQGCGTIYKIDGSGNESVVYSFKGGSGDGSGPNGDLIQLRGILYGVTEGGGGMGSGCNSGCGTAFRLHLSGGKEKILVNFDDANGKWPLGGLVERNGELYGTTGYGGAGGCTSGCGTVFKLSKSGAEKWLFSFNSSDGYAPQGDLVDVDGTIYGTTLEGGRLGSECYEGCGTVFKVTPDGSETPLYSFKGGSDGADPFGGLVFMKRAFYGTTRAGGSIADCNVGCGTIFKLSMSGKETVLYRFKGGNTDGEAAEAGLTTLGGSLYGTTTSGGAYDHGTVFAITP
jgi:uncharacterized repeat protein (TIGR03803 family)